MTRKNTRLYPWGVNNVQKFQSKQDLVPFFFRIISSKHSRDQLHTKNELKHMPLNHHHHKKKIKPIHTVFLS